MAILGMFGFPGSGKTTVLSAIADRENRGFPSWFGLQNHEAVFTSFPAAAHISLTIANLAISKLQMRLFSLMKFHSTPTIVPLKASAQKKWSSSNFCGICILIVFGAHSLQRMQIKNTHFHRLHVLDRTFYFDYSIIKPIRKDFDITNDITDKYFLSRPIDWIFVNRKNIITCLTAMIIKTCRKCRAPFGKCPCKRLRRSRIFPFSVGVSFYHCHPFLALYQKKVVVNASRLFSWGLFYFQGFCFSVGRLVGVSVCF